LTRKDVEVMYFYWSHWISKIFWTSNTSTKKI